jgi:hypothetical protein
MKALSYWAFTHKWSARLVIVVSYILLNLLALFFATILEMAGIELPALLSYLLCIPFLVACILYPKRKRKAEYRNFYLRQKTMDAILACTSFLLVISFTNQSLVQSKIPSYSLSHVFAAQPANEPVKPFSFIKKKAQEFSFLIRHWHQIKKNYAEIRQAYRDVSPGGKFALIVLASLVAIGLLILVLGLSCNLSCSGNEGAALVVFILGVALITFGLVKVIRSIKVKRKGSTVTTIRA